MKNFILLSILMLFILACKPEPSIEEIENTNAAIVSTELTTMNEKEQQQLQDHTAQVSLTVPDSTWSIKITQVIQTEDEIAVLCQLSQSDMMGMMVISEAVDAVKFKAKDLPIKYYIKGKRWNWENQEAYTFLNLQSEVRVPNGETINFEVTPASKKSGAKITPIGTPL